MGKITPVKPVKLIIGLIFKDKKALDKAKGILVKVFGRADLESPVMPFAFTDYYAAEFGSGLKRVFLSFEKLILPQELADIKITANKIEKRLSCRGKRTVNIDPGYLDLAKLVLASTKDYTHRVYLNKGIFAEITLFYRGKSFQPWQWTYPDYRTKDYLAVFNRIREIYAGQLS